MRHAVDTNVLIVASNPVGTHVPPAQIERVLGWVAEFDEDANRPLVLDLDWRIFGEYARDLTDQDYGMQVATRKLRSCHFAAIAYNGEYAVVPPELRSLDPSDREFAAVALTDPATISIVNASDTDWIEPDVEAALLSLGIRVDHLIEDWLRPQYAGKHSD